MPEAYSILRIISSPSPHEIAVETLSFSESRIAPTSAKTEEIPNSIKSARMPSVSREEVMSIPA